MIKKIFLFIMLISTLIWANQFSISFKTNTFQVGERIALTISVLNEDNTIDTNYSGYVRLSSDNPLLKIQGKNQDGKAVDIDNQGNILLTKGINNTIFCYSYKSGQFYLTASEIFQNSDIPIMEATEPYTVLPSQKQLLFNEVMYKTSQDSSYEYIEIYNNSDSDINSKTISIYLMTSKTNKTLLASAVITIPSHNYLLLSRNIPELQNIFLNMINSSSIVGNLTHSINSSCQLILYTENKVQDSFEYESDWVPNDNISLERISLDAPSYDKNNWEPSIAPSPVGVGFYGTPGEKNSHTLNQNQNISLSLSIPTRIINKTENLVYQYSATTSGKITIYLMNSQGKILKTLTREKEIAQNKTYSESYILNNVKTGLYLLTIQFINEDFGLTKKSSKIFIIK